MRLKLILCAQAVLAVATMLYGCGPVHGKRPFLIAEVCLKSADDLAAFRREMQSVAQSQNAAVIDRSTSTQMELDAGGHSREGGRTAPAVNLGIKRGDEMLVMVGNLGLPGYQVALGFSEGSNPTEAHRFADTFLREVEARWHVEIVHNSAESGAGPMKECD